MTKSLLALPFVLGLVGCASSQMASSPATTGTGNTPYIAAIDIRRDGAAPSDVQGAVFDDGNRNGRFDEGERGVPGVKVSNGVDVAVTGRDGQYRLPVRPDMSVFVVQPSGWQVPTDERRIPQFAYEHKPAGSPKELRFGGLPPTGDLPSQINFPLIRSGVGEDFHCAVLGDTQVYSNAEVGYARDSVADDLVDRGTLPDCLLAVGDVMGDDLGLIPRFAEIMGAIGAPQWWVHGNHDYDFDADSDADSADSWRRLYGPAYYAYEMGEVTFIVLDNVVYPCGAEDNANGMRDFCVSDDRKRYNGRITQEQMDFVENLLAVTPKDRLIVFAHHIPFVSFVDNDALPHQTDNVLALYDLVKDREALSLSGHTHTVENLAAGDSFAGWESAVGVRAIPFRHLVAGAVSGGWWNGDYDVHGVPMSLQRQGGPRGYVDMLVSGTDYTLDYRATGLGTDRAMWLSISTPAYRSWAAEIGQWLDTPAEDRNPIPPLSVQDLPDVKILTPDGLRGDSWLTANVWMGDSTSKVTLTLDGGAPEPMIRTQRAEGEAALTGPAYSDPFALQRQFTVARSAIESRSGVEDAQGYASGRRPAIPPAPPQPRGSVADRNMHLWTYSLPTDLADGVHVATVTVTREQGESSSDSLIFEVRDQHPPRLFRQDVWNAFENGPPVR